MQYRLTDESCVVRLERGERLLDVMEKLSQQASQLTNGLVSGIGATSDLTIGFYNLSVQDFKWRTVGRMMEVVSLSGNVWRNEQGALTHHLHGVFSDDEYQVLGGHVRDFTVGATLELCIMRKLAAFNRHQDVETGLELVSFI